MANKVETYAIVEAVDWKIKLCQCKKPDRFDSWQAVTYRQVYIHRKDGKTTGITTGEWV